MSLAKKSKGLVSLAILSVLTVLAASLDAIASGSKQTSRTVSKTKDDDALHIGVDAYIFGYPLVTMEMTRRVMTNAQSPDGKCTPMGQFDNLRTYPTPSDKAVTTPNADTLYSSAWLDLSSEPYVLSIPDADGRFYLIQMLDAWTNVFGDPGTRSTGTHSQKYVITGPLWKRKCPEEFTQLKSPTNLVWILGRTYSNGTQDDYAKVHAFQDGLSLVPLSAYAKDYNPPAGKTDPKIDATTAVRDQVNQLDAATYFSLLAQLMNYNPPRQVDAPIVSRMSKIGIVPGQTFDMNKLSPEMSKALADVPRIAQEEIMAHAKDAGTIKNGWSTTLEAGKYGTDYLQRALVTAIGFGANLPQDAVYPMADVDSDGKPLDGNNKYKLHFDKEQIPPVEAFWSMTMYDANRFFVPNALNRYSIGSRSPLKYNEDGSLDLYFQKGWPGRDKQANWLQAPDGKFILTLRMYWPKPDVVAGNYTVPPVRQIQQ
jgi:hypothetical protein